MVLFKGKVKGSMLTATKYWLFQVPGWVLAAIVVTGLHYWIGTPAWVSLALFALWVLKDVLMYPLLRSAYETGAKTGVARLIGATGIAQEDLAPSGYVRVKGELWHAELKPENPSIPAGSPIRIVAAQGMTLVVIDDKNHKNGPV